MTQFKQSSKFNKKFIIILELVLLVLFVLVILFLNQGLTQQVDRTIDSKVMNISQTLKTGVDELTQETQIVNKLVNERAKHIAQLITNQLGSRDTKDITNDELLRVIRNTDVTSLTLIETVEGDLKGIRSTEPKNIDLTLKDRFKDQEEVYSVIQSIKNNERPEVLDRALAHQDANTLVIRTVSQNANEPRTKQIFYQPEDVNYMINATVDASELEDLTQNVGLESKIASLVEGDPTILEIALINPNKAVSVEPVEPVDPEQEPVLEGVKHGSFRLSDTRDTQTLETLADNPQAISYVTLREERNLYKAFIPAGDDILYIALNHTTISQPVQAIKNHLIIIALVIMSITGVVSYLLLKKPLNTIELINTQVKAITTGDYTYMPKVETKDELQDLSESINTLVKTLNQNFRGIIQHIEVQKKQAKKMSGTPKDVGEAINLNLDKVDAILHQFNQTEDIVELLTLTTLIRGINDKSLVSDTTEDFNSKRQLILSIDNLLSKLDKLKLD